MPKRANILIVDDERSIRELLEIFLKKQGYIVTSASSAEEGLIQAKATEFDVIISDIKMADMSGIDFLRELRDTGFLGQFILLTAFASAETAIQALKMGGFDYILKTENFVEELKLVVCSALENRRLREENTYLRREFKKVHGMGNLIGKSKNMQELFKMIEVVSATNSTVLITGESGTGKELVEKAIHLKSPRAEDAFVSVTAVRSLKRSSKANYSDICAARLRERQQTRRASSKLPIKGPSFSMRLGIRVPQCK